MKIFSISKDNLSNGLALLAESYRLFGPVKKTEFHDFKELAEGQAPDFDYLNTRLSAKSIIYPQSEPLLEYTLDESREDHHIMKEVDTDYSPRAVFGIRPCDAKAFLLVGHNFDTPEYKDPYWIRAYEATTLVGLACDSPCSSCFCTTAGCGPHHEEGLDVLLVDTGDQYLANVLTDKGEKLMAAAGWCTAPDTNTAAQQLENKKREAEAKVVTAVNTDNLRAADTIELYDASFWEDVSFSCINCGTCTFVCPTCWCFDIQDENRGKSGQRMRNWDSCMFPLFTLHGSGHNPRGTKLHRVRQRFMHKLKYYVDKYDVGIQCVGCGRCIRSCPVNIDIRRVCELMNSFASAENTCAV
ncbi:MAG: 4Fe-4S dicluster domain-containing protein [Desulfobacterales bacterium]|nr:MAG: 4Fe-4S dicluster domain-containing protein [Desulfobacterales bacterium]